MLKALQINHKFEYPLFYNLDLTINQKKSVAIVGVSGSGKSTLLHILSTFLKPDSGVVDFFGKDLYSLKKNEIENIRRNDIGIIFQQHFLFKGFSALENINVASFLASKKIDKQMLIDLGINDLISQKSSQLSGGQQQRVSIARVLVKEPKIIFADEPTGNLDHQTAFDVMRVLLQYIQDYNASLFLVTHDQKVANMCDEIYKLEDRVLQKIK